MHRPRPLVTTRSGTSTARTAESSAWSSGTTFVTWKSIAFTSRNGWAMPTSRRSGTCTVRRICKEVVMKIKFYYSSKDKPGEQYPCNIQVALGKVRELKAKGIDAEAIDVAGMDDLFRPYHAALTGPPATVRA